MRKKLVIPLAITAAALLLVSIGLTPDGAGAQGQATPTRSLGSLFQQTPVPDSNTSDAAPALTLSWLQLSPDFSPVSFSDVTVGGPVDVYPAHLSEPCAQNIFAAELPVVELHLQSDLANVEIDFATDNGTPTAIVLWDSINQTWWCSTETSATSAIGFDTLAAGDYPVYVGVEGSTAHVTGTLSVLLSQSGKSLGATGQMSGGE